MRGITSIVVIVLLAVVLACGGDDGGDPAARTPSAIDSDLPTDPQELMAEALRITFRDIYATVRDDPDPSAVLAMGESGDERYIPVLVDILRFPWLLDSRTEEATNYALAQLSGRDYDSLTLGDQEWVSWVEWLSDHPEIEAHDGYVRWKGNLLTQNVDTLTGALIVGAEKSTIRFEEIVWGGVPRDGIPDLQEPAVVTASEAEYMNPNDRVYGVTFNGESRAYPLRIMNAHEMANDVVGGVHFALAYCTLCGSGIAYATEVDGDVLSFGTSGLLYRSNKLMYDRGTRSLWNQFGGDPVVGDLVGSGIELEVLPMTLTTWSDWLAQHPDTDVPDIGTGRYPVSSYPPEDDPRSIYYDYRNNPLPIFPVNQRNDLLPEKELVIGLDLGDVTKAYTVSLIEERSPVNDTVGDTDVVVLSTGDVGAVAYERNGVTFVAFDSGSGVTTLTDDRGRRWLIGESALVLDGEPALMMPRLESRIAFWFAWYQFHPLTAVYQ